MHYFYMVRTQEHYFVILKYNSFIIVSTLFRIVMQDQYFGTLKNEQMPIGQRYQSIFHLKNINTAQSIKHLMEAYQFCTSSSLLTHQIIYALGQVKEEHFQSIKQFLISKITNQDQTNVARHQAAESLANYFHLWPEMRTIFQKYSTSQCKQLKYTCQISLQKVKHKQLKQLYGHKFFQTKEPAAPFTKQQFQTFLDQNLFSQFFKKSGFLGLMLKTEEQINLFTKYRIMYYMRDIGSQAQRKVLCQLLTKKYFKTQTSLLKHQVCFILGQIGCGQHEDMIRQCIQNNQQDDIVRHQALAAVASQSKDLDYLQKFTNNENKLISDSAKVAQFTIKYWCQ